MVKEGIQTRRRKQRNPTGSTTPKTKQPKSSSVKPYSNEINLNHSLISNPSLHFLTSQVELRLTYGNEI